MAVTLAVVGYLIWVYVLLVWGRIIVDFTRQFARSWRPAGATAVGLELMYLSTDPPIKLLRRLVPPLRLGTVSLDLSVIILLIVLYAIREVVLTIG